MLLNSSIKTAGKGVNINRSGNHVCLRANRIYLWDLRLIHETCSI